MRNWNKNSICPDSTPENLRTQSGRKLLCVKRRWEGICGTGKQHMAGQRPREFTDAKRAEIALREKALGGHMRNWKTAYGRTAPQRIYGRKAGGNCSA